jgi:peptide/nickel transport system permease protein
VTVVIATTVGAISALRRPADTAFMRLADLIIATLRDHPDRAFGAFDVKLIELACGRDHQRFGGAAIIIKSQALTIRCELIEAARVAGGSDSHIILRHIIPPAAALLSVHDVYGHHRHLLCGALILGLLNIRMSWGLMIHTTECTGYLLQIRQVWLIFPASLPITMLCAAFYLVEGPGRSSAPACGGAKQNTPSTPRVIQFQSIRWRRRFYKSRT